MKTTYRNFGEKTQILASSLLAFVFLVAWLSLFGNHATAQTKETRDSSARTWSLIAENLQFRTMAQNTPPTATELKAEAPKISEEVAVEIAREAVPGEVTDVEIEKRLGANRYVVEIIAKEDDEETDIIVDMETGKVLDIEK